MGRLWLPALVIPVLYLVATLGIGWFSRRRGSAGEYLNASRSIPLPLVTAAYLASNCGSLELIGMSSMASRLGVQAFQFFWIGAIPAMVFVALVLMPIYRRGGINSVPEYLAERYGARLRRLNAAVSAVLVLLLSGVSLYAMAQVMGVIFGLGFGRSIVLCASVVLVYVLLGGIRATIYNEVLQLGVIVAGLLPLAVYAIRHGALRLAAVRPAALHLWRGMPLMDRHAPVDVVGVVAGLGFVLSFSYWCTDFVLMQCAFKEKTEDAARQVPLWAGFGKMGFSLLVVLPGLLAMERGIRVAHQDQVLAVLMRSLYGPAMLGLALTALAASLMSGLAANVSAFAALWTEDLYKPWLRPGCADRHYLAVGRWAVVAALGFGLGASYLNFLFSTLIEHLQLIFSVLTSPFWAIFLLGFFSVRADERGALWGFFSGAGVAFLHSIAVRVGWLRYGSGLSSDFYGALFSFGVTLVVCWVASRGGGGKRVRVGWVRTPVGLWVMAVALLVCCVALNVYWW